MRVMMNADTGSPSERRASSLSFGSAEGVIPEHWPSPEYSRLIGHRAAFSTLAVVVLVGVLGCGGAAKTGTTQTMTESRPPHKSVPPRQVEQTFRKVEHAFPALHLRLVDSGIYTSIETPIIRVYALNVGRGSINMGTLWVYATVKRAAAEQPSSRGIRRANLIAQFDPGTPGILRSIITVALNVAATGSGRIRGHSLSA
jgi:hypothetical protein